MQAQHNLAQVLRGLGPGEPIAITRNSKVVAELHVPASSERPQFPDFAARISKIWGDRWVGAPSQELLDDSRGDR